MHDRPPPGWNFLGEQDATPVWQHRIATLWIATDDPDLLRCLSAALLTFRHRGASAGPADPTPDLE